MSTPTVNDSLLTSTLLKNFLGEDVVGLFKCGICWEFYSTPVVLPCGHTFCYNCLLEMGRHAKANKAYIPLQDLLVNCPNCRQPIFVVALMARQITLNYPMTSLLEALKGIKIPGRREMGTNTEPPPAKAIESDSHSDVVDTHGYYDKSKIDDMVSDLDDLFKSFRFEHSVLTDCRDEVEEIRRNFNRGNIAAVDMAITRDQERNNQNRKRERKQVWQQSYDQNQAPSSFVVPIQQETTPTREYGKSQRNTPYADPAIVSFAVGHDGKVVSRGPVSVNLMDFLSGTAAQ